MANDGREDGVLTHAESKTAGPDQTSPSQHPHPTPPEGTPPLQPATGDISTDAEHPRTPSGSDDEILAKLESTSADMTALCPLCARGHVPCKVLWQLAQDRSDAEAWRDHCEQA